MSTFSERRPAFSNPALRRRALFVTYGASHVAKVAPVVHELRRRGIECLVMALTIGHKKACQLGLEPLGYKDFLHLVPDAPQALARGRALAGSNSHPDVDAEETCSYLGVNYQEWVDELGEAGAQARYAERGRQGFMPVAFMGRVIDALSPGVVVATSTPRSEEAAIRAAHARAVPTLTMVDLFAPPSDPFLWRGVHADRITVVSQEVRARFVEGGLAPQQVVVTGSPDFDELFDPQARDAGRGFRESKGWSGHQIVLWAGIMEQEACPGMPPEYAGTGLGTLVETELRRWVASRPGVALVVRYHPGQYHAFPVLPPQDRVHVSDPGLEPILPLLHASDAVIHQVSTVGFQAALLKKRVLNLAFSSWARHLDFDLSSLGPSENVDALAALVPALQAPAAQDTGRKMTLPDGPAAPRVADEVMKLLET